jgi:tRNA (mo5U34)-methyltransferase
MGFELARNALGSRVNAVISDVYNIPPGIGQLDVVLFMGLFYHLKNPLLALEIVAPLANQMLVVEINVTLNDLKVPAMRFFRGANWMVISPTGGARMSLVCAQCSICLAPARSRR